MHTSLREDKIITVKKDHPCEWCNEKILKGEKAVRRVYLYDGYFQDVRQHPECNQAMKICPVVNEWREFEAQAQKRGQIINE